jgi:hypothetical protein
MNDRTERRDHSDEERTEGEQRYEAPAVIYRSKLSVHAVTPTNPAPPTC